MLCETGFENRVGCRKPWTLATVASYISITVQFTYSAAKFIFLREFARIHVNSRNVTLFRVNSHEFTKNIHTFSRFVFHEILFLLVWTANNAQNSLSWAFSQKIFYFSY
jgi:hypothetical protein